MWDARTGDALARTQRAHGLCEERVVQPRRHADRHRKSGPDGEGLGRADGDGLARTQGHRACESVSFSPDGTRIVTRHVLGQDEYGEGLGRADGHALLELKGHTRRCVSASFSPDGSRILTGRLTGR